MCGAVKTTIGRLTNTGLGAGFHVALIKAPSHLTCLSPLASDPSGIAARLAAPLAGQCHRPQAFPVPASNAPAQPARERLLLAFRPAGTAWPAATSALGSRTPDRPESSASSAARPSEGCPSA